MTALELSRIHRCEAQLRDFLADLLKRVPVEALSERTVSDKWSARENLAHLTRYHEIFIERLERIVREIAPAFARYKAEDDPGWPACAQLTTQEILSRLESLRQKLISRLKNLNEADFQRTGIHPKLGEMTLSLWLEFFLVHEGHHLYNILLLAPMIDQA